jgi:hypothetical protein
VNAVERFRLRFQSLVAAGLASTPIAARVGLVGASEVWGGAAPRERPAWYLWLRDAPGAWQLELAATEPLDEAGGIVGRFTVRHYPAPGTPVFARFSVVEQRLVRAALDRTGTPRIDLASTIPDELFTVGTIDWALAPEVDATVFGVASLDRLRTLTRSGALVRDVPGWSLALPAFSAIAGLHAQVERRAASRVVVSRLPGFETFETSGAGEQRDAAEVALGEGFVSFPGPGGEREPAAALLRLVRDADGEVIHELDVGEGDGGVTLDSDPRIPLTLSRCWFGGEHHRHDRAMCAC